MFYLAFAKANPFVEHKMFYLDFMKSKANH